jgi:hypothetical protein
LSDPVAFQYVIISIMCAPYWAVSGYKREILRLDI